MIMNGVQVLDVALANTEAYISNMSVDENVASSEEPVMEVSKTGGEEGMMTEGKSEEEMEKLKILLQHQLEYYFSSENLTRDQYLVSQMDGQQYVPIWTIANFNLVKNLTTDINLITEVLKSSSLVQVDERNEKVRPNQTKFALILREIPEDTPIKSVEALFDDEECPRFLSCEFAANTSWYVSFEKEADAQAAYRHLREKVKTFLGKPIMARIKSKTHHFNTYSSSMVASKQQGGVPGPILSPPYISPAMNVFTPPPGAPYGGQAPPFITAIPTQQPPGTTSPHSSTVATTTAPTHVYVVPPGTQPWYPTEHVPHPYGNQAFGNAVFQSLPPQAMPNYMGGKRNAMYGNKGNYINNNYLSGDMQPGRNMQPDNRIVQLQTGNTSAPDGRPHYLPAVSHLKMPMGAQQTVYTQNVIPGPYYNKKGVNGKQNGNIPNGGPRYNRSAFPYQDSEISPRFQKKGMQPQHHHQRYSTSRNNPAQDYTNRHNSDGGVPFHNGPMSVHDTYTNASYVSRNNSTGHDTIMNGSRLGPRQGYAGNFPGFDSTDAPPPSYSPNDVNNNAAKRQNIGSDTVQNVPFPDNRNQRQQRRLKKNGDSRSSSARPSPPAPPLLDSASHEGTFNLENTSFPPLPGAAASNAVVHPVTSSTDAVSKPQVPEESYKNSLKMNLVSPVPTMTASPQPTTIRSHPVAKEESMQTNTKEQEPQKDLSVDKDVHSTNASGPTGKTSAKGPKAVETHRQLSTARDAQQPSHEKVVTKPNQKQTKASKTAEVQKGKSEPSKPNTSDKNTVSTAESDAVKKLSYAEMLRKKTAAKPATTVATDENENPIEPKKDNEEQRQNAPQTSIPPKNVEKSVGTVNGGNKNHDKQPQSPTVRSEDSDEKPWESAGHTKRSHRADRSSTDHSHHNGYDSRDAGYQRNSRNGGFSNRGTGTRGRGRGRGGYGRSGGRFAGNGYNGRERYNSAGSDRQVAANGDVPQRKR